MRLCEILQRNKEGELKKLLTLEIRTSLVIFFQERNFRRGKSLNGGKNHILKVENKEVQYQV